MTSFVLAQTDDAPAGGAAIGEVLLATALGLGLTVVLLGLVFAHRTGRTQLLTRAGERLGGAAGVPGWVALPTVFATASLLTALLGMLWDISLHIGQGRDEGPLANPAHFLILFGLFGVFAAGVLACSMPVGVEPGPAPVRLTRTWHVPIGGLLLTGAGFYALLGFPLDDVWHRLFGQDVTLWGPTHLMLIGGAGLSILGLLVLEQEGHGGLSSQDGDKRVGTVARFVRQASAMGGLLLGLSVFQGEFDFGVPQFRLVLQPFMIAAAAGLALVAARLWMGRGGALAAVTFFLTIRGAISVVVGPVFGEITPSFPLYLGSAVVVELVALALLPTLLRRRPMVFAAVAGALIGTVGHATETAWSQVAFTLPWGTDIAVEGAQMAVVGGVSGALIGGLLALGLRRRLPRPPVSRTVLLASLLAMSAAVVNGLVATVPEQVRATMVLTDVPGTADAREVQVEVQVEPADHLDDPSWVQITAWQGDGLVVERLERTGPGAYRTTEPVPVHGEWKTLLRLHDGRALAAVPIYLPADAAIDAELVPASASLDREVVPEITLLQRERNLDVPSWLWAVSNLVVLACSLALVAALTWGVARYARTGRAPAETPTTRTTPRVPSGVGG